MSFLGSIVGGAKKLVKAVPGVLKQIQSGGRPPSFPAPKPTVFTPGKGPIIYPSSGPIIYNPGPASQPPVLMPAAHVMPTPFYMPPQPEPYTPFYMPPQPEPYRSPVMAAGLFPMRNLPALPPLPRIPAIPNAVGTALTIASGVGAVSQFLGGPSDPRAGDPGGGWIDTITRWGQRVVPGGKTGRQGRSVRNKDLAALMSSGGAPVVHPDRVARYVCTPGFVLVEGPDGAPVCMLKSLARSMGLWTPSKKPPISVGDWRQLKTAHRAEKKIAKVARMAGFKVEKKGRARAVKCSTKRK